MKRILVLDDELSITFGLSRCLKSDTVQVMECNDTISAKYAFARFGADAIIADVKLSAVKPEAALDFVLFVRSHNNEVPLIMMSGAEDWKEEILEGGANYFLTKPVDLDRLSDLLRSYGLEVGGANEAREPGRGEPVQLAGSAL